MRLLFALAALTIWPAAAAPTQVTFHKNVQPILQARCQECHRAGEAAPMSLVTYKETRPFAKAIREAVKTRRMPPWHADPHVGKFANDRSLSQTEIDTLSEWADSGAPEGDAADAPPPARFASGWAIGKPDAVFEVSKAFPVPAAGTIEYTYFIVPSGFTEDKWVEQVEVRPGARDVIHHIVAMVRPPGSKYLRDVPYQTPYVPKQKDRVANRPSADSRGTLEDVETSMAEVVSTYVPGGVPYLTEPGQARLIKAGSDFIFQMHYTPNGKAAQDVSRIGMTFARNTPKQRVINGLITNRQMRIPPGAENHRVDATVTLHEDVLVQSLFPHMHLRGKAFEYTAKLPSGETKTLLRVPNYDFNWQLTYYLDEPVKLPKGTELTASAWYDNSPNNKYNPDPKAEVFWGDQSWEEMIAGFVDFVIPVSVDPARIGKPAEASASGSAN